MNIKKVIFFSLGPLFTALVGLLTLPVMAWLYSSDEIARYALIQVLVSATLLLFTLGLDQAFVREYHDAPNKDDFIISLGLPGLLLLLVTLALSSVLGDEILNGWFGSAPELGFVLVSVILVANYVIRFLQIDSRMKGRALLFSFVQVLPRLLFLLFVLGAYFTQQDASFQGILIGYSSAYVVAVFVALWLVVRPLSNLGPSHFDGQLTRRVLGYSLPLVVAGFAYWGLTSIDKILLRDLMGLEPLAVYSMAVNFAGAAIIFQQVFSTIWAPAVYRMHSENVEITVFETLIEIVRNAILLVVALVLLLKFVVAYLLPPQYFEVQYLLSSCMIAPLLYTLSECSKIGIGITRKTLYTVMASLGSIVVALGLNYWFIPMWGAAGASVATMLAFYAFYILRSEFSRWVWKPVCSRFDYLVVLGVVAIAATDTLYQELSFWWVQAAALGLLLFSLGSFFRHRKVYIQALKSR